MFLYQQIPTIPTDNVTSILATLVGILLVVIAYLFKSFEKKQKEKDDIIRAVTKEHLLDIKEFRGEDSKRTTEVLVALDKQMGMMKQLKELFIRNE